MATEQLVFPAERETERLFLKGVTPALIHQVFRQLDPEAIKRFFGVDDAGYEHYKNMHEKGMETHRISHFAFLLFEKNNPIPIGDCGFHSWYATHRRAELFYALRNESFMRKGYVSEALPVVLAFGFQEMNLHRVEALVADWNEPSVRLLLKSGFQKEGTAREDYFYNGQFEHSDQYSLLRSEWEARQMVHFT